MVQQGPSGSGAQMLTPFGETGESWASRTFSAMKDRHYRNLYIGNILQFGSMNMQQVVRGYLVYELTGSFAALGTMSLANAIPQLIFSPIGGVIADRAPKKTVIQIAQGYNALNAVVLAVLAAGTFGPQLAFWHLFLSAFLQGVVNSVMQPSRQSFISDIVPRERLTNAIGLNASAQTMMQLIAPGLAGFLIASVSSAVVFWTMAAMYAVAVTVTARLPRYPLYAVAQGPGTQDGATRIQGATGAAGATGAMRGMGGMGGGGGHGGGRTPGLRDLADGMKYVAQDPTIRMVLAVNFLIVIVAMPYQMLLPGFLKSVLGRGPQELGWMISAQGIGALIGAMFVASTSGTGRGKLFIVAGSILGVGILAFAISTNYWITLPIMVFIGIGQSSRMSLGQILIQSYSQEQYRGRVMSVWFMEFGFVQLGTFFVGILAEFVGPQYAIGSLAAMLIGMMIYVSAFTTRMRRLD